MEKLKNRLLLIDADTILYASASQQQKTRCIAKYIPSDKTRQFDSKTDFNSWLKDNPKWKKEDFSFESKYELFANDQIDSTHSGFVDKCISFSCKNIKEKIAKIVDSVGVSDYRVVIQGDGNFRKEYQTPYVQYKAQRPPKPLLYQPCFDYMKHKYGKRCVVVTGEETDDWVIHQSFNNDNIIVAYVDKDIPANAENVYLFNYFKPEGGIILNTVEQQARAFATQWLIGDTADNIDGILKLSDDVKKKFKIKTKGVGEATAEKILEDCKTPTENYQRVLEVYQSTWPDDWFQRMQDYGYFLYLRRREGEVFELSEFLNRYGVKV